MPLRPLREIAVENAVEGAVRETFGALVALHQAARAKDPVVRRAMKRIAADERRHAELAHDVAAFCDARLDASSRAEVRAAMSEALVVLRDEIDRPRRRDLESLAGVPSPGEARRLLDLLEEETSTAA